MTQSQGEGPDRKGFHLQPWPGADQEHRQRRVRGSRLWGWSLTLPWLLGLPFVALTAAPARADSRTAESIWSQSDAQQRAIDQIPLEDRDGITQTRCQEVGVGRMGSLPRFRCTVLFTPASKGSPGGAGNNAGGAPTSP